MEDLWPKGACFGAGWSFCWLGGGLFWVVWWKDRAFAKKTGEKTGDLVDLWTFVVFVCFVLECLGFPAMDPYRLSTCAFLYCVGDVVLNLEPCLF